MKPADRLVGGPPPWRTRRGRVALALGRHRRAVAAGLVAVAALVLAAGLRPGSVGTVAVLTAAHDLTGGAPLRPSDLNTVRLPSAAVPAGAVHGHAAGRVLAGPMRRGEPLTDARLLGPRLLAGYGRGLVAAPVRVADADMAALLHPGDHIDILAASPDAGIAAGTGPPAAADHDGDADGDADGVGLGGGRVVAGRVPVVAVPHAAADSAGDASGKGALVVVAVPPGVAASLAGASTTSRLTITLRPR